MRTRFLRWEEQFESRVIAGAWIASAWIFALSVLIAVLATSLSFWNDNLIAPPTFDLRDSATNTNAAGVTSFTPTELADTGQRFGWNGATALVVLGIATAAFTAMPVLKQLKTRPIFSRRASNTLFRGFFFAGCLIAAGVTLRSFFEGRIRTSVGLEEFSADRGPELEAWLWILDIPFGLVGAPILFTLVWVWARGRSLQRDVEAIV